MKSLKLFYFSMFIAVSILFFIIVSEVHKIRKAEHVNAEQELVKNTYQIISESFATNSEIIFKNSIDIDKVKDIFKDAYKSTEDEKVIIRKKLHDILLEVYNNMRSFELKQLHFHLPNNESFLRFHRPQRFGDNLTNIRKTVAVVNKHRSKIQGFEEGRIFNGYRFVYPLFLKHEYLGSVEVSVSMRTIVSYFAKEVGSEAVFIIKKDIVEKKLFKSEINNYLDTIFSPDFVYERDKYEYKHKYIDTTLEQYTSHNPSFIDKLNSGEPLVIDVKENSIHKIISFLPINSSIDNTHNGYIVVKREHVDIHNITEKYYGFLYMLIIISGIILYALYRNSINKKVIVQQHKKLQKLIDIHESIIILTDGTKIDFVNLRFEKFFNLGLQQFTKYSSCICKKFIKDDNFFYLGKIDNSKNWVEEILTLDKKDRLVSMLDFNNERHIFSVAINNFDEYYITSFTDVSESIQENVRLEEMATHDALTGAYNRLFFTNSHKIIIDSFKQNKKECGIILFDIDHFKHVNDNYGHNIGDIVLKELVTTVQSLTRTDDRLIRWGGEEFIIILPVDNIDILEIISENIRKTIEEHTFDEVNNITCSFGSTILQNSEDINGTIERADKFLYHSKHNGRNIVTVVI